MCRSFSERENTGVPHVFVCLPWGSSPILEIVMWNSELVWCPSTICHGSIHYSKDILILDHFLMHYETILIDMTWDALDHSMQCVKQSRGTVNAMNATWKPVMFHSNPWVSHNGLALQVFKRHWSYPAKKEDFTWLLDSVFVEGGVRGRNSPLRSLLLLL